MTEFTRKEFIKLVAGCVTGGMLGFFTSTTLRSQDLEENHDEHEGLVEIPDAAHMGILFDATRCIGCLACVRLCKEEHGLPPDMEKELSAKSMTVVQKKDGYFMRRLCMHCLDPSCVSVCPVGALTKLDYGAVVYDESRCIGCRYCMMACPFKVPRYEWWSRNPRIVKCDMCQHRVREQKEVACAWVCPLGATTFDTRDALLEEARRRIDKEPEKYQDHIYGEKEAGGTSTLYLLPLNAKDVGLPENLGEEPFPHLTWQVMRKIPYVIGTGAIMLCGIWWIINRRIELEEMTEKTKNVSGSTDSTGGEES